MMPKLPHRELYYIRVRLEEILNTDDVAEYAYWKILYIEYTAKCKVRTKNLASKAI